MPTAIIQLPEELKAVAAARAAEAGYATVEEYVGELILADAGEPVSFELENHLLRALETPSRSITTAEWEQKRRALSSEGDRGQR